MPTHYLMLSFDDFGVSRDSYRDFLAEKARGAGTGYTLVTFEQLDDAVHRSRAKFAVRKAAGAKLKVMIHGHGDGIHDLVTNDAGTTRRDTTALANLIEALLQGRASVVGNAPNTSIVMLSCLFGRARSRDLKQSNLWTFHQKLHNKHIYVEMVARTELVVQTATGTQVSTNLHHALNSPASAHRKVRFTKVRCRYDGANQPEITLVDSTANREVSDTSHVARQHIWALDTMDQLTAHARSPTNNANHRRVTEALTAYDTVLEFRPTYAHDPPLLKQILEYLAGIRPALPVPSGFNGVTPSFVENRLDRIGHRSIGFFGYHSEAPKTKQLITRCLANYP